MAGEPANCYAPCHQLERAAADGSSKLPLAICSGSRRQGDGGKETGPGKGTEHVSPISGLNKRSPFQPKRNTHTLSGLWPYLPVLERGINKVWVKALLRVT